MAVKWLDDPESHDYDAAADYLSMLAEVHAVTTTVDALKAARPGLPARRERHLAGCGAAGVAGQQNAHVKADLAKISDGKKLSPILLVRGNATRRGAAADRRRLPPGAAPATSPMRTPRSRAGW